MTFGQFLAALRARWLAALAALVLIVGATAVASLVWPKRYSASASVVIDIKPDPVTVLLYPGLGSPQYMATQVDIINSDRVSLRVVRNLKLAENPQVRQQWLDATSGQGSIESWLADSFQRGMEAKPSRESNVITVTYKAPDPRFAAALANAFVQAYMDTTLDMRVNPAKEYSSFFDTRLKEARDALEQAQAKLSSYQRDKSIIATDERLDVENARLSELSSQVVVLQALSAESGSRQVQAQGAASDRVQELLANPLIAGMKAELNRSEVALEQLGSRLGDRHPQVIEARVNVAELRAKLDAESRRVLGGVAVSNNINKSRESQVRAELELQRAKVLRMKAVRDEGQVLARDVENAQRAYDAVQSRLTQTSLESQTRQSNVFRLSEATVPLEPSSPRVGLNLLLAVFVGAMVAVALALGLEFMDRRVRDPQDLGSALGLAVIAVLPDGNKKPGAARRRSLLAQQRVVGRLAVSTPEKT
jgi:polysaccharide biosynthesis transport protein